jgi:retron-type reverse transcriptase
MDEKMKTYKHLFDSLCSFENLLMAYRKARKGSGNTREAQVFHFHLEPFLLEIQAQIKSGNYQPGAFRYFQLRDPKARTIAVAPFRDRVVHHALINILEPIFEQRFIFHSYATRKGKGTHKAIAQAQHYMRRWRWFFKADIKKFFDSVDHDILLSLLAKNVRDPRLLDLASKIIRNGGDQGKGLPIGNLTSQFLANVYLDPFDHFIKDEIGIKGYLRYMDDFVIFGHSRSELKYLRDVSKGYLSTHLQLSLKEKACFLNQRSNGLSFLGTRIFEETIRIHPQSLKRLQYKQAIRKKEWKAGKLTEADWIAGQTSAYAHLASFDTLQLRKKWIQ